MSEPISMPVPGAAVEAECCATCTAFVSLVANGSVGNCIAKAPTVIVTASRIVPIEGQGTILEAIRTDGAFPKVTAKHRCRDDYRRKVRLDIPELKIESPVEGGEQ